MPPWRWKNASNALEVLGPQPEAAAVAKDPWAVQPAAELIADEIAADGRRGDDGQEDLQPQDALAGQEAAEDRRGHSRHEEADDGRRLEEDEKEDDQVRPGSQLADNVEAAIEHDGYRGALEPASTQLDQLFRVPGEERNADFR